ncbi:MAG: IclR family transcriptional regulator [Acidobacteriota bacterium]
MVEREDVSSVAVERALAILEAVAERAGGMTNSELSRRVEIPKSSASYILRTLERCGYLKRDHGGRYRLGLRVLALGRGVQTGVELRDEAISEIHSLVKRTGLTAHLAVMDRGEAVYVEKVESPGFVKMDTWVGRRMQVNSTSVGKALAAYLPESEVQAILKERGLKKRTPKTITLQSKFTRELSRVRERGYAVDDEENSLGARCVAAPIFDGLGRVQAAIGVSGTTGEVNRASLSKIAMMVKDAAMKISRHLGYRAPHTASRH